MKLGSPTSKLDLLKNDQETPLPQYHAPERSGLGLTKKEKNMSEFATPILDAITIDRDFSSTEPTNKYEQYEYLKHQIRYTAKTPEEYERRIKNLCDKLGI